MKKYCPCCDANNRTYVEDGALTQRFIVSALKKNGQSLRCVCDKKTLMKRMFGGVPMKAFAIVGSMWCISMFSQAQEGLVVQSEKVYLGKNQQPAPILKVVPVEAGADLQMTTWEAGSNQEKVVKLTPIKAKKTESSVQPEKLEKQKPVPPEVKPVEDKVQSFEILEKDETLSLALRRWSVMAGYQLVWDSTKDFPARRTDYGTNGFEEAIEEVMRDTSRSSYPLHACLYKNKVLRVLHVSQSCER